MADEERWRRSSRCVANNHCVEVAGGDVVKVRDRAGSVIEVDRKAWQLFIDEVSRGSQ
jgi:hypothetical protein